MRNYLILAVALLASFTPNVAAQSVADEVAVRTATEQRIAIWNAKDVKAYLALLDEDCEDWLGNPCAAGLRESGEFPATSKNARGRIYEEIGVQFITSDVAIHKYRAEWTGYLDADGKPLPPIKNLRGYPSDGPWR